MNKLGSYISIEKKGIEPKRFASESFFYYSLPDFDETQSPGIAFGNEIDSNKFEIESGTILISKLNPRIRRVWKVENDKKYRSISSTEFVVLKPTDCDFDYLYYYLQTDKVYKELESVAIGSTNSHTRFRPEFLNSLNVNFPKTAQQRKIAKILSTCDTVIAKTEEAIAKYQALKQGMMHDLFTRGIDLSTGKLRPKYQDAPELYKESELGMIPKDWEVKRLGEFGEFKNGLNKDKDSYGHGTPFVNIIDAYPEKLDVSSLGLVDTNSIEREIYKLLEGDIIFVRSSVKPDGVGYNTIYESSNDQIVYCGFMIRFRIENKEKFIPSFYNLYFRSQEFRRSLLAVSTVSANTNINQDNLSKLFSIYPQKSEQLKAIEKIENINKKIAVERASLAKYHQIKSGLMQDLLSGKVEVSVSKEEEIINA